MSTRHSTIKPCRRCLGPIPYSRSGSPCWPCTRAEAAEKAVKAAEKADRAAKAANPHRASERGSDELLTAMEWVMPLLADIPPGPDARRAVRSICRTSLDELKAERPFLLTFRPLYRAALDCWDETNAVTPTGPLRR